ncbi:MAG: hypothetical protein ABI579_04505 [Candidatus Sumerlaeota bacterium]
MSASARYVSCRHCGTSLEVKRSSSAEWTEMLQQVSQNTERIHKEVEAIRVSQEIEQLDREWEMQRDDLMITTKDGARVRPTVGGSIAGIIILGLVMIVGIVMCTKASNDTGPFMMATTSSSQQFGGAPFAHPVQSSDPPIALFACFFLLFGIFVFYILIRSFGKAKDYDEAEKDYHERRLDLVKKQHERR